LNTVYDLSAVYDWIRTTVALLHNHQMRIAHMCMLAIVTTNWSLYRNCFWRV